MSPGDFLRKRDWPTIVERLGISTVLACAAVWGIYQGLVWIGTEIFKPVLVEQVETSKVLRQQIPIQTETTRQLVETQKQVISNQNMIIASEARQTECLDRMSGFCGKNEAAHEQQSRKLEQIDGKLPAKPPGS